MLTQSKENRQANDIHEISMTLAKVHDELSGINAQLKAIIGMWGGVHRYPDVERCEQMHSVEDEIEHHAYDSRLELYNN